MTGIRSIPYQKERKGHGLFVHYNSIWQGITRKDFGGGEVHRIGIDIEEKIDHIDVPDPEIHGMMYHDDKIWFCCSRTHKVCTIPLP
jgi:hypothetical protein